MGKKKKKQVLPWCWYCDREFENEKVLIDHQKAKHFKCIRCNKKLSTAGGMIIHLETVHKETLEKVPNALVGRDSVDIEIFGMDGVPEADLIAHEHKILYGDNPSKRPRNDMPYAYPVPPGHQMGGPPGMPFMPPPYGQPPPMPSATSFSWTPAYPPQPLTGMPAGMSNIMTYAPPPPPSKTESSSYVRNGTSSQKEGNAAESNEQPNDTAKSVPAPVDNIALVYDRDISVEEYRASLAQYKWTIV